MRNRIWIKLRNITTARWRKVAFIKHLPKNASVLDVGCGNGGPSRFKSIRPDLYYVGIDVGDYNNSREDIRRADEYIVTSPDLFPKSISELGQRFDAVVSSHNLEHCNHPEETLVEICGVLKTGGLIFLAFPSEESVYYPKRKGTLNFYDDATHIWVPNWSTVQKILKMQGISIIKSKKNYRPFIHLICGMIFEPLSRYYKRVFPGTWALYGFESVIWGRKDC